MRTPRPLTGSQATTARCTGATRHHGIHISDHEVVHFKRQTGVATQGRAGSWGPATHWPPPGCAGRSVGSCVIAACSSEIHTQRSWSSQSRAFLPFRSSLSWARAFRRRFCCPPSRRPPATHERPIVRAWLSGTRHGRQTATRRCLHPRSARQPRRPRNLRRPAEVASAARSVWTARFPPRDAWCGTSSGRLWRSWLQSAPTQGP